MKKLLKKIDRFHFFVLILFVIIVVIILLLFFTIAVVFLMLLLLLMQWARNRFVVRCISRELWRAPDKHSFGLEEGRTEIVLSSCVLIISTRPARRFAFKSTVSFPCLLPPREQQCSATRSLEIHLFCAQRGQSYSTADSRHRFQQSTKAK